MEKADELKAVLVDPDYVALPRYGNSLKRVLERYPDGVPTNQMAAKALMMSEEDFERSLSTAMEKLRAWF